MEVKTKYEIGQKVYIKTENGLELKEIQGICIYMNHEEIDIQYKFTMFYSGEGRKEHEIITYQIN